MSTKKSWRTLLQRLLRTERRAPRRGRATSPLGIETLEGREMLSVSAGGLPDDVMEIGTNIEGVYDWMAGWTFTDIFKHSRGWISHETNTATGEFEWHSRRPVQMDVHGWPTGLDTWTNATGERLEQSIGTLMALGDASQFPAGVYRAEWDGEAEVHWEHDVVGVAEQGVTPEGRHYALLNVVPTGEGIHMHLTGINPDNPIRNINVWMPDYEGQSFAGQRDWQPGADFSPFHPLFVERLADFPILRYMQFLGTNDTDTVSWSDRRELSDARQVQLDGVGQGAAIEYAIELSNQLGADAWLNIPHTADDDYVRNFATLVRDTLDPELEVYVEWSNELWNFAPEYPAFHWITEQLALPENAGVDRWEFAAAEIRNDFAIWSDVFAGQEDRLVRVLAGHTGNPWVSGQLLAAMDGQFDGLAVGGYFAPDFEERASFTGATTVDEIIEASVNSIATTLGQVDQHRRMLEAYESALGRDLELLVYEGGSHLDGRGAAYQSAIVQAFLDPRMYGAHRLLMDGMNDVGVDRFVDYQYTQRVADSPWGNFGALRHQDQAVDEAHKFRALRDALQSGFDPSNQRPGISALGDLRITAGSSTTVEFTVSDAETAADELRLLVDASESGLLPNANLELQGSGSQRTLTITAAADQSGLAMVTLLVDDTEGGTALRTFDVEVLPAGSIDSPVEESPQPDEPAGDENQRPSAANGAFEGREDDELWVFLPELVADDATPWHDLRFSAGAASAGTVALHEGVSAVFQPAADYHGPASFTYTVTDGGGLTATGRVELEILPVNDAPTARHLALTTMEDQAVEFNVRELASDPESGFEELQVDFMPSWMGHVELLEDGATARFTPRADETGVEDLWFSVTDPEGLEAWNVVDIGVLPVNDVPTARTVQLSAAEDDVVWIELGELASDVETPLEALRFAFDEVPGGEMRVHDAWSATFTPAADHHGEVRVGYTVHDLGEPSQSAAGEIVINVTSVNDAPRVDVIEIATREDAPVEFSLREAVRDAETPLEQLTIAFADRESGTVERLGDGQARFTPRADLSGTHDVWYSVTDTEGRETWGYLLVDIAPVNDAPVAAEAWFQAAEGDPLWVDLRSLVDDIDSTIESLAFEIGSDPRARLMDDGYTLRVTASEERRSEFELWYRVFDDHGGDDWNRIVVEFDATGAADAVFTEWGACA